MVRQIAPGALIQRRNPQENRRIKSELSHQIAEAADQRVRDTPADCLRAVQTGVVVFAKSGAAKSDDCRCWNVQKERGQARLFSFPPRLKERAASRRGVRDTRGVVPKPAGKTQAQKEIYGEELDRSEEVIELQDSGDKR